MMCIATVAFSVQEFLVVLPVVVCALAAGLAGLVGLLRFERRPRAETMGWVLALAPVGGFVSMLWLRPWFESEAAILVQWQWMPSLGMAVSLYFDGLAALFAFLITGIGGLVLIYTGYYFHGDRGAWRFFCYILLFMASMLGVVLAGDVITLFVFWELTSITSFLLIGYKYTDAAARGGAFKSLLITGGGGIALLAGLLLMGVMAEGWDFETILASGDLFRGSGIYPILLGLIALGAFTKSAQAPFHVWLPDAMSAPTPASAFLHSATMVKAGIYLLARFNPVLGETEAWFWLLGVTGAATMVIGAYMGLRQHDLKGLLAYSTVSQLGVMTMLIGQGTGMAYKALMVGIVAHALYKAALFLVVGIVDHEKGTRDLRELGGLRREMPLLFGVTAVAGASMAGLPPLFGFLAKETLLETVAVEGEVAAALFTLATVLAGGMIVTQAAVVVIDTFMGRRDEAAKRRSDEGMDGAHPSSLRRSVTSSPAVGMLLAPGIPAALSLVIGLMPGQAALVGVLSAAAAEAFSRPIPVELRLWHGWSEPLLLSLAAVGLGVAIFQVRRRLREMRPLVRAGLFNSLYGGFVRGIDLSAWLATRTQHGWLRWYLGVMLASAGALFLWMGDLPRPQAVFEVGVIDTTVVLRAFALAMSVAAAGAAVILRQDLLAILALGGSGLAVALLFALEPAPDVALVMIVVDILTVVILMLTLTRLPRRERERTWQLTFRQRPVGMARDIALSVGGAVTMTLICLTALQSRPRESVVTPFYETEAIPQTGSDDIVGAILIDFRAMDTLIEIAVFAMAGAGVYTLLRFASRKARDHGPEEARMSELLPWHLFRGIGGLRASPLLHGGTQLLLPIALLLGAVHVLFGHYRPGDGFTAGVILSLAVGLRYVVMGYRSTRHHLWWLRPATLIGSGLTLILAGGVAGYLHAGHLFAPVNFLGFLGISGSAVAVGTALLFDFGIAVVVLGGASFIVDTLGRPRAADLELAMKLRELAELERRGEASPYEGMGARDAG